MSDLTFVDVHTPSGEVTLIVRMAWDETLEAMGKLMYPNGPMLGGPEMVKETTAEPQRKTKGRTRK